MANINKLKKNGFTLVELVVVITIIGILMAIAVPKLQSYKAEADNVVMETNVHQLYLAAQSTTTQFYDAASFAKFQASHPEFQTATPSNGAIPAFLGYLDGRFWKSSCFTNFVSKNLNIIPDYIGGNPCPTYPAGTYSVMLSTGKGVNDHDVHGHNWWPDNCYGPPSKIVIIPAGDIIIRVKMADGTVRCYDNGVFVGTGFGV